MKYYIGLDIGTTSVGWAVTDERYSLIRKKGKDMWGVRLFDEANTAAERRSFRTSRRRLQREKARIGYLKEIFAPAINEKDPGFFRRLEDSRFFAEDKTELQPFALFADTGYTDKEYYQQYPTIFHLRKALIESEEEFDVRLVYLAILNMFKHRGHFLNPNLDDGDIGNLENLLDALKVSAYELFGSEFILPENIADLEKILTDRSLTASDRQKNIVQLIGIAKSDKSTIEIWKLICGLTGKMTAVFEKIKDTESSLFSDENKTLSLSFRDSAYEEEEAKIAAVLSEESFEFIQLLKQIHDFSVLSSIMKSEGETFEYISMAKVASYEKHKKDLKILKDVYKNYLPGSYDDMFRVMKENNYSAYAGSVNSKEAGGKGKIRRGERSGDFFQLIKKQISKIDGYENIEACVYILGEIDRGAFLPKQRSVENGVIPNQLYRKELKKILENAQEYLPFLNEKDSGSGLTASEQILALFSFRIPYYVGPLKGTGQSNHWAVRKEDGPVMPWNIEDRIDIKKTSENFIENLVRHCSYISDEKVLPRSSLLYERFMVLNELNRLKINNEDISAELKHEIYTELFRKSGKKVTNKKLINFLKLKGVIPAEADEEILSGYDKETGGFTNTLANYHKFTEIFGTEILTDRQKEIAEGIIFYSTVYGDSKKFLKERINELYADELTPAQIERILGYKFRDWGNLSGEFLRLEGADKDTGEVKPLISRMWDENKNLMQLLSQDKYTYYESVLERTSNIEKSLKEITYEDLDDLYISAPVRRMVWQTIKVVQEIEKIMKEEPEHIFIEMTRSKAKDPKRTVSRKTALLNLYKNCKEEEKYLSAQIEGRDERNFRIKKLYLYYLQKGRCMYSGETIDIENLFDDNFYDIDHIYPRHYVKDDSLENNLVLVKAKLNREKTDEFPISVQIRQRCAGMWKTLREGGFISEEKYKRLTRNQPFSEDELIGFINRQLVETGQGTKAVAELLTQVLSGGKANERVIYVKAGNVSEFRQKYGFVKCRAINDFHHANDAYLNIVVGNIYFTKFTRNARNFFRDSYKAESGSRNSSYNLSRIFDFKVERAGILAWEPQKDIVTVKRMMAKNTPIVTRRSYEVYGAISDQQIVGTQAIIKAKGVGYIPVKSSDERLCDTQKYGGFNKVSGAYFFLVEHTKKKKRIRTIENMPVYLADKYEGKEGLEEYCRNILKLEEPDVRLDKIRMYSLMKVNGFYAYLASRTGDNLVVRNAVQMCFDAEYIKYIHKLKKAVENKYSDEYLFEDEKRIERKPDTREIAITKEMNLNLYDQLCEKYVHGIYSKRNNPVGNKLLEGKDIFAGLSISRQCYVLAQILQLSGLVNKADLRDLGFSENTGTSKPNKNISRMSECKLILQSVTGLYEQEIDLLKI